MATLALEAEDVGVRFGGLDALRDVSLHVEVGEIHGIIGPNGSGKTTLLNAISGFVPLARGRIRLGGEVIDHLPTHARVRRGLSRTFQSASIFGEMNLIENVRVGSHRLDPQSLLNACIPWRNERLSAAARSGALEYLATLGLDSRREELADSLPYGQQRLLDFARAQASRPRLLLLDEPTAGLNIAEIDRLQRDIRTFRDANATVVLIEHHMPFVMGLCDRVTVLDFGQVIASGSPAEIRSNPAVIESYLGAPKR